MKPSKQFVLLVFIALLQSACRHIEYLTPMSNSSQFILGQRDSLKKHVMGNPTTHYLTPGLSLHVSKPTSDSLLLRLIDSNATIPIQKRLVKPRGEYEFVCRDNVPRLVYALRKGDSLYYYEKSIDARTLEYERDSMFLVVLPKDNETTIVRPTTGCGYAILSYAQHNSDEDVYIGFKKHRKNAVSVFYPDNQSIDTVRFTSHVKNTFQRFFLDPVSGSGVFLLIRDSILESGEISHNRIMEIVVSSKTKETTSKRHVYDLARIMGGVEVTSYTATLSTNLRHSDIVLSIGEVDWQPRKIIVVKIENGEAQLSLEKVFNDSDCDRIAGAADLKGMKLRSVDRYQDDYILLVEKVTIYSGTSNNLGWSTSVTTPSFNPSAMPMLRSTSVASSSDFRFTDGMGYSSSFSVVRMKKDGEIVWVSKFNRYFAQQYERFDNLKVRGREDLTAMMSHPVNDQISVVWREFAMHYLLNVQIQLSDGKTGSPTILGKIDKEAHWFGLFWVNPTAFVGWTQVPENYPLVPFRINMR